MSLIHLVWHVNTMFHYSCLQYRRPITLLPKCHNRVSKTDASDYVVLAILPSREWLGLSMANKTRYRYNPPSSEGTRKGSHPPMKATRVIGSTFERSIRILGCPPLTN
ncbi:hypothetical protein LshimejAT787_1302300 [Lyophyllum shimeji]|uniref:Uncharacterized protein n=1 Tax=Lyophyllum shimeji TaxID=47721 RepID=A0A9P3UPZ1_LYOSH|nr:hypothetical protein LshimejAT787_1302300 [Lyophyllum shimeji]